MSQYFIASEVTDYQISSHLLREGYFKSMSIFSDILENWQGDEVNSILELAIDKCDSSILHKFKKHKSKNVKNKDHELLPFDPRVDSYKL